LARVIAGSTTGFTLAMGGAGLARADESCARIEVSSDVPASWSDTIDELRTQIARLDPSDCQPTVLSIRALDSGVRVVATTSDGRTTERDVRRGESLVATGLGLVMAIPPEPRPPRAMETSAGPQAAVRPNDIAAAPPAAAATHTIGLWGGLSSGLRLTSPTAATVLDVETRIDLLIDRWLLLATIRSALLSCLGQQGTDCDVYTDVSAGIGVGRRFLAGGAAVDVALQPSIVAMHIEYDLSKPESNEVDVSEVELRLDASARLSVPMGRQWALTLTVDGGLAPALLVSPIRLDATGGPQPAPEFPAWCGGLRLGVSGALL
jgi:hypothetical protein